MMCKNCFVLCGIENSGECGITGKEIPLDILRNNLSPDWCPYEDKMEKKNEQ